MSMTATDLGSAARRFHALSDPTRLRILEMLRHGERCVCDLTAALETGQSRLSFHLKTLKDAGILRDERRGRWVYYALREDTLGELRDLLERARPVSLPVLATAPDGCCG